MRKYPSLIFPKRNDYYKIVVCGTTGSGKTYYSKQLIKKNDYTVLVFTPHEHDFKSEPDNFILWEANKKMSFMTYDEQKENMDIFINYAKKLAKKGLIDGVFIDEFDLIFRSNYDFSPTFNDFLINHRHYKLFMLGITRRPQDIPAKFFEQSHLITSFCMQGVNNIRKFNNIQKGLGDSVSRLNVQRREFIIKEQGGQAFKFN